jgi:hypothetical protein
MARRPSKKAKSEAASKLAEALNFIAPAYKDGEEAYKAHARLAGKMITATDGVFSAGHSVEEELALCPHIGRFIDALNRAGSTLALTENENGTLLVKGDRIRATVPCLAGDQIPQAMPDPRCAAIDDRLKDGFARLLPLIDNEGERVVEVSVLLQANSMTSTNGRVIFEYWHGIDLPPGLVIPKTFAAAVAGCGKKLEGFGFSNKSVTFYFEDGSWYKTQQYGDKWPETSHLFNYPAYPAAVPEGLFEAVKAVESFSKDGLIHFHDEKVKSTYDKYQDFGSPVYGATFDVPGLQKGHSFTAKLFRSIEPVCAQLDYTSNDDRAFFFDETGSLRGCIMKARAEAREPAPEPPAVVASWTLPEGTTGEQVGEAFAALRSGVQAGTWGVPEPSTAEAPAGDPANPWAAIVGTVPGFVDIDDDDVPF